MCSLGSGDSAGMVWVLFCSETQKGQLLLTDMTGLSSFTVMFSPLSKSGREDDKE